MTLSIDRRKVHGKDTTLVIFGRGQVCIGNATDPDSGNEYIYLGDTFVQAPIEVDIKRTKDWDWNEHVKGEQVVLVFSSIDSIEVLEHTLETARIQMLATKAKG